MPEPEMVRVRTEEGDERHHILVVVEGWVLSSGGREGQVPSQAGRVSQDWSLPWRTLQPQVPWSPRTARRASKRVVGRRPHGAAGPICACCLFFFFSPWRANGWTRGRILLLLARGHWDTAFGLAPDRRRYCTAAEKKNKTGLTLTFLFDKYCLSNYVQKFISQIIDKLYN